MVSQLQKLPVAAPTATLETVAQFDGAMPTGVTVSHQGRIFVNFPKWGDEVEFTVAEIRDGKAVPYPSLEFNQTQPDNLAAALVSVQSVVIDPLDRLWLLDTGSPMFQPTQHGGPKLVCVDLTTDRVINTILFPQDVALPTTYLNDIRFDLRQGDDGIAFITDSSDTGPNGIIIVDLGSGESWRKLHDDPSTKAEILLDCMPIVEGQPLMERQADGTTTPMKMGADGIAINAEGSRIYYCPLISRRLYSIPIESLVDRDMDAETVSATVTNEGDKGGCADGLESDAEGYVYATNFEQQAILRRMAAVGAWETVIQDPRLMWTDTMSIATDGYLYIIANQLHRQPKYQKGQDLRQKPYTLFRIKIDAEPVLLRV
ncbi:L-dopachrome tautomerase-related protein [Chamaesiphon sp.]|uniref:L-dopachrome tautomerase-related protein n=1 Tax=Chamaesiphon sp. TaxID=2814140 RepID=UPI003593720A